LIDCFHALALAYFHDFRLSGKPEMNRLPSKAISAF